MKNDFIYMQIDRIQKATLQRVENLIKPSGTLKMPIVIEIKDNFFLRIINKLK